MPRLPLMQSVVFRLVAGLLLGGVVLSMGLGFLELRSSEAVLRSEVTQRMVMTTYSLQNVLRDLVSHDSTQKAREALSLFTNGGRVRASRLLCEGKPQIELGDWSAGIEKQAKLWHLDRAHLRGDEVDLNRYTLLVSDFDHLGKFWSLQLLIDGPAAARQMRSQVWGGVTIEGLFLVVITLLGLLLLRRWVTGPLAEIMELLRANAGPESFRHLARESRDEFGLLAGAIGGMLQRVDTTADRLRRSEAAFQHLYQFAPAAMVSLNPQGQVVEANRRAAELFAAGSEAALVGRDAVDLVRQEDRGMLRQTIDRLAIDALTRCELRVVAGDKAIDVLVECGSIRDQDGILQSVRLSLLDITEWKLLQRQVAHKSQVLNVILDHISDAILLVDVNGKVAAYNRQLATLLNLKPGEHVGDPYEAQSFWDELGVAEKDLFVSRLRQIDAESQRPAQERFVARAGTFLFQGIPVHDPTQQPLGRLWVVQEITSQEQSERLLETQEAQLQALKHVSVRLSDAGDVDALLERAGRRLHEVFHVDAVGISLRSGRGAGRSRQILHRGTGAMLLDANRNLVEAVERQLMPEVLAAREIAFWPDLPPKSEWSKAFTQAGLTSVAAGPLRGSHDAQGVLWIARRGGERLESRHLFLLEALAPLIAVRLEVAQLREQMQHLEMTDPLTALPNRRQVEFDVRRLVHRPGYPWSLVLLKVDHFREINSVLTHDAADKLLCSIAARLRQLSRRDTIVVRPGGSIFGVLCPGANRAGTLMLAERLRLAFHDMAAELNDGTTRKLTASIGVVASPDDGIGEDLLDLALARVELAKRGGRDRIVAEGAGRVRAAG
ncbi:MAG: diguanylate cyclase [Planctomycetota bacterium]|nr:diguanylate cyclase [Planctomycetota bacterium]